MYFSTLPQAIHPSFYTQTPQVLRLYSDSTATATATSLRHCVPTVIPLRSPSLRLRVYTSSLCVSLSQVSIARTALAYSVGSPSCSRSHSVVLRYLAIGLQSYRLYLRLQSTLRIVPSRLFYIVFCSSCSTRSSLCDFLPRVCWVGLC